MYYREDAKVKKFFAMLVIGALAGYAIGASLLQVYYSTLETAAAECVQRSNGTDSAVEDCYTSRGLRLPE